VPEKGRHDNSQRLTWDHRIGSPYRITVSPVSPCITSDSNDECSVVMCRVGAQ
jgi:hypothetical protein